MKSRKTSFTGKLCRGYAAIWKNIHKDLEKYFEKKDNESLHRARVEMKKLTALFHLLDYCDQNFDSQKKLKPVTKIFKLSGKLRDYRNAGKFCKQFKINIPEMETESDKQLRRKLKAKLEKYDGWLARLEKETSASIKNIGPGQIGSYLHKIKKEIFSEANVVIAADKLHEVRKRIKEVIYLNEYSNDNMLPKAEIKILDQLQEAIGDWHDIDKFCRKVKESPVNEIEKEALSNAEKESQKLRVQSTKLLQEYAAKNLS